LVEEEATEPRNILLAGLASRLHEHQLYTLTFVRGVEDAEIGELLSILSEKTGKTREPFGAAPPEERDRWPHINITPVPYASISLSAGTIDGEYETGREGFTGLGPGAAVDTGVSAGMAGAESDTAQLEGIDTGASGVLKQRISNLILKLDPQISMKLHQLLQAVFQSDDVGGSARRAYEKLEEAVGGDAGDKTAASLLQCISTLGSGVGEAMGDPGMEPSTILGELANQLSSSAEGGGPAVEDVAAIKPIWVGEPKAERVIQMSVELDETTSITQSAVRKMLKEDKLGRLLDLLDNPPDENETAETVWGWVTQPRAVRSLLETEPPDFELLDRLLPRAGDAAAKLMIDTLIDTESETTHLGLIDRLIQFGDEIGPLILSRMEDKRPHVRRNLLLVMSRLPTLPGEFSALPLMGDMDPNVRRQAMELGLTKSGEREQVIVMALQDPAPEIVMLALDEVSKEGSSRFFPHVISLIFDVRNIPTLGLAVQTLGSYKSPEALAALLRLTWKRKMFILYGLTLKSTEMLAALEVLKRNWADDPKAKRVLKAAGKSKDAQIRAVVKRSGGTR